MIRKKTAILGALVLVFFVAIGSAAGTLAIAAHTGVLSMQEEEDSRDFTELEQAMDIVQQRALQEHTDEELIQAAVKGMMEHIDDKYAYYFTEAEYQEYLTEEEGIYVGIGIQIQKDEDTGVITVSAVFDDTPSSEAGIKPGDTLVKVEDEDVTGMDVTMIAAKVRGQEGEAISLTLARKNEPYTVNLVRREVTTQYLQSSMLEGDVAYIRLLQFSGYVDVLFEDAIRVLVEGQGARGLIIDLRNNSGGDKGIVCNIADLLMPEGPIITLEDRFGNADTDYSDAEYLGIPIVVLVNEYSASASELLAGSLQDTHMATIVGVTTYGKGTAQQFYQTAGKGMVKLTTCRYLTAGGHCVQDIGVIPDIVVEASEELGASWLFGGEEDNQLAKGLQVVRELISRS